MAVQVTFGLALLLNLVEAVAEPRFAGWMALRVLVAVAFIVALLGWAALWFTARRARSERGDAPEPDA
jgi:hypothetical protein